MTEAEWLAAPDLQQILWVGWDTISQRKLRLFLCACYSRITHLLTDERSRRLILACEQYADRCIGKDQLQRVLDEAFDAIRSLRLIAGTLDPDWPDRRTPDEPDTVRIAEYCTLLSLEEPMDPNQVVFCLSEPPSQQASSEASRREVVAQSNLFRDIFANPFRPVVLDPSWRTEAVVALAEGIYTDKAFDRMTVLADALEDAGCSHEGILSHCRGAGPHVKGCWVVDLLTGRK